MFVEWVCTQWLQYPLKLLSVPVNLITLSKQVKSWNLVRTGQYSYGTTSRHVNLILWFKWTIFQYRFRKWLGADQARSHFLNQWWLIYWSIYASLGPNESKRCIKQTPAVITGITCCSLGISAVLIIAKTIIVSCPVQIKDELYLFVPVHS